MYGACVFMFLLSVHGGIQLGKYSVYNTLCLQLTFLINCNRNTAISSLIAGRIQLYISSLSRTQKLWLPNFQRERIGREGFYIRVTGGGGRTDGRTTFEMVSLKAAFLKKRLIGADSVASAFAFC